MEAQHDVTQLLIDLRERRPAVTEPRRRNRLWMEIHGEQHPWTAETPENPGLLHTAQGDYAAAESLLTVSYTTLRNLFGPEHEGVQKGARHLVDLYDAWGKPQQAAAWRDTLALTASGAPPVR